MLVTVAANKLATGKSSRLSLHMCPLDSFLI